MNQEDRKILDSYLGKGIRHVEPQSSLLQSTSPWLNNAKIRELVAVWLLRKNGPDFPVEADHTLGLSAAMNEVITPAQTQALFEEERKINPELDAWFKEGFISTYKNEDFEQYAPGTVGGMIWHQIKHFGFDITLGMNLDHFDTSNSYDYWKLRARQMHDFEHIITGGQFNSIGELCVIFGTAANQSTHFSPKLSQALNNYLLFTGLRMVCRSLLHYPETWPIALKCVEQGIRVGQASPPMHFFKFEEVFHLTPEEARQHFGMPEAPHIDTEHASAIFREEPIELAQAAE